MSDDYGEFLFYVAVVTATVAPLQGSLHQIAPYGQV